MIGVVILLVVMMMSFSGYLLPWDQLAPTGGFVPPAWIDVPGYSPGELPARMARCPRGGRPRACLRQVVQTEGREGPGVLVVFWRNRRA